MRKVRSLIPWRYVAMMSAGATFFLGGCDAELRSTVENGIISVSQSFLASLLQAFLQLGQEATA